MFVSHISELPGHADIRGEFSKLVSHHVLRYAHIVVRLAIVYLKDQAHKIGENGCATCLGLYGLYALARFRSRNG